MARCTPDVDPVALAARAERYKRAERDAEVAAHAAYAKAMGPHAHADVREAALRAWPGGVGAWWPRYCTICGHRDCYVGHRASAVHVRSPAVAISDVVSATTIAAAPAVPAWPCPFCAEPVIGEHLCANGVTVTADERGVYARRPGALEYSEGI